jgi:tetratricopeptide (TPR) repeat protein/predicted aspartyl protease
VKQFGWGVPVLAAALCWGSPLSAACSVAKIADLPVTMQAMKPLTEAKVNGTDVRFTVDSGAFFSVISPGNAKALGLNSEIMPGHRMRGINGDAPMSVATVKSFTIAGQTLPRVQFVVAGSDLGASGIGVIGQNFLGLADAEYDLPHGVVRLMQAKGCEKGNMAYWANGRPYSVVEFAQRDPRDTHTIGIVFVNGVKVRATFDTGAGGSILSMAAAARAGITPSTPGVEPAGFITGFGRKLVRTWIAPFKSFKVGDQEELHNGRIRFGEMDADTDMLIGADFFIAHRVYVANSSHRIFLTYEGGPVFNLTTQHRDEHGAAIADAPPPADETPTTAEGFSRSGAVKLARDDRAGALADFDRAIAMDPAKPAYLLQRAELTLGMGRRASAAIDIDKALALAPEDVDAHLLRARLILAENGFGAPGMAADLDAVDRAAPPSAMQRLALGQLYTDAGLAARAIAQFDQWLKYHPDDVRRPSALNGRCWARGLGNTDLPAALSDCNAAIRAQPGNILFVDSRALVELRMGQFDKAIRDYDMVLAKQSRPWAIYMRGMAKQRSGDASGKAEMEAALKTAPRLIERAKAYGLAG